MRLVFLAFAMSLARCGTRRRNGLRLQKFRPPQKREQYRPRRSKSGRWAMKKRRERALHLFQLTGRESAVNRLHVDKVRQGIVQKMVRAPWWCAAKSRSETETGMTKRKRRRRFDKGVSTRPGLAAASPSSKDSPRDVALRE